MRRIAWAAFALWGVGLLYLLGLRGAVHPDLVALYGFLPYLAVVLLAGAAVLVLELTKPRR